MLLYALGVRRHCTAGDAKECRSFIEKEKSNGVGFFIMDIFRASLKY